MFFLFVKGQQQLAAAGLWLLLAAGEWGGSRGRGLCIYNGSKGRDRRKADDDWEIDEELTLTNMRGRVLGKNKACGFLSTAAEKVYYVCICVCLRYSSSIVESQPSLLFYHTTEAGWRLGSHVQNNTYERRVINTISFFLLLYIMYYYVIGRCWDNWRRVRDYLQDLFLCTHTRAYAEAA